MQFGIREICDVVLRAKSYQTLGSRKFHKNEPVLYFDTLKTSSLEGAATTVYAQGGTGNTRLIAWEGERTLTFTMEDALLSMESFAILSGAGLIDATPAEPVYVHQTSQVEVKDTNTIILPDKACWNGFADKENEMYHESADIFVMVLDDGEINAEPGVPVSVVYNEDGTTTLTCYCHKGMLPKGSVVLVDYYVKRTGSTTMIEITADKFGGNYYLEASTLFRRKKDGVDMPAEFIIPNCKVQSNFTFSMAATGDPSTFTFTLDAFPDYTKFDRTHKVLAAIQVITEENDIDTENGKREPCGEKINVYKSNSATVTAKMANNSITAAEINASGKATGLAYDPAMFPEAVEAGKKGVQITVSMPVEADSTQYDLKITNPYTTEETSGTKTKTGIELQDGVNVFLSEEPGDVKIELSKINGDFHKTYIIKNNIIFGV